jgi:hypothetical protein
LGNYVFLRLCSPNKSGNYIIQTVSVCCNEQQIIPYRPGSPNAGRQVVAVRVLAYLVYRGEAVPS